MRRRRSNLLLYLILNIVVSALTTLAVLWGWDQLRPRTPEVVEGITLMTRSAADPGVKPSDTPAAPPAVLTPAPAGAEVIEISSVIGAGDLAQEVILLKRKGEGDISLNGWKIRTQSGVEYAFPPLPEQVVLFKGGAIQIFTRAGTDTATELYWNRTKPAWTTGDVLTLMDETGTPRAVYTVP